MNVFHAAADAIHTAHPEAAVEALVQEIDIHAPADRVFRALTRPEDLLQWWAAEGRFRATEVESDLRPGGKWRMRVEGACGADASCSIVSGTYLEIATPHLLVFTWLRENEDDWETTVRWELTERDGVTTARVTHSGFTSERMRNRNSGWVLIKELLRNYSERQE